MFLWDSVTDGSLIVDEQNRCYRSAWGPLFLSVAGFLFFFQGALVATFALRRHLLQATLAALLVVGALLGLTVGLLIDMRPQEVALSSLILDLAIFLPFAVATAVLGAWVKRRPSIGVALVGALLLALWVGMTDPCRYPRWMPGAHGYAAIQLCEYWGWNPVLLFTGAAILLVIQGGVVALLSPAGRVSTVVPVAAGTAVLTNVLTGSLFVDMAPTVRATGAMELAVIAIACVLAIAFAALGHVLVRRWRHQPGTERTPVGSPTRRTET